MNNQHCVGDFNILIGHQIDLNIACYDHKRCGLDPRGCVYDEARAILWLGQNDPNKNFKDDPNLVVKQVEKYKKEGMTAYSKIQQQECAREKDGYTSVKHQREVGTSYFDAVSNTISSGKSSTTAMEGSTESEQF